MSHGHVVQTPTPAGFRPHTVAHHFGTAEQEFQSLKLGFWLFLATEVMLFGGLFALYFIYKGLYPETFKVGGAQLNWLLGAFNTIVLLTSSWTMAMGVRSCQLNRKKPMLIWLCATIACACAFMVVKYFEWGNKFSHGIKAGEYFAPHGEYAEQFLRVDHPNLFFTLYYTMTGLHGFHVLVGIALIGWLVWQGSKGRFHSGFSAPVDLIGLYWHIVDLIWIFLFPLLYLVP